MDVAQVFGQQNRLIIRLKWRVHAGTGSTSIGPLAADLNNDGLMEIVVTGMNGVAALNPLDGRIMWSLPSTFGGPHVPFEIVDLNKDNIPEILLGPEYNASYWGLVALHGNNGSIYWYNPKAAGKGHYIAVADINADGYPEIFSATQGKVTALTYDGRIFASTYTYYPCSGGMTIGDTDFDGVFEVYLGERSEWYPTYPSGGRGIRAFWANNLTEIWCDPQILCSSHTPVLADVDKDGDLEIIILHQRKGIAVYNTDGSVNTYKGKYRRQLYIPELPSNGHSNPTVADVDDDGNLELIQCGNANGDWCNPAIWDLVDWKLDAIIPFKSMEPPGVADVDGDGKLEILVPTDRNVTILKYNKNSREYEVIYTINNLPRAHPFFIAQDIDGDSGLELVFNQYNSWISVYDVNHINDDGQEVPVPAPTPLPRSGRYFYSEYRTRVPVYVPLPGPPAPKITEPSPKDEVTNVPITISQLSFKLIDYQCDPINYTVTTNPDIGSASGINVPNGRITIPVSGLAYATTYTWTVTATDGKHTTTKTFSFTTMPLAPWYNTDWRYRKTIVIDYMKVAADQTNFPVLIDLTDIDLTKAQLDGDDIVFTDQNQVKLSHEIEQYDNATGRLIAWVKVPHLSSTTYTLLYMYYGNPDCDNQQNQTEVWDKNYLAVLHLDEKTGLLYDSTANGNNGTPYGALTQGAAGAIGNCVEFNGGYIGLPRVCKNEVQFTFSAWIYPRPGARYIICEWWSSQGAFLHISGDGSAIEFYVNNIIVSRPITLNQWYYVVGTFDGATARLYVNNYSPVSKASSNPLWPSQELYIGDRSDHTRKFYGFIDEVRVSNIARDTAWILTEYNNQFSPSAFYVVCPEESLTEVFLTVLIEGNGTVAKEPDSEKYVYGTSVKLTAVADVGYTFSHWEGSLTGNSNPATILMSENKTVTAVFVKSKYTLTTNVNGCGSVSRNYTGPYYYGSVVQLEAIPDPHWEFVEWGGDYHGKDNPITIVMTGNMTITVHFAKKKYVINASAEGTGGTIQPNGLVVVEYGQSQTFIITPDVGYHISDVKVDGESVGQVAYYTFNFVDDNHTITASFAQNMYTLTVNIIGEGSVDINPQKMFYTHGEVVQLTAVAGQGWTFSGWSGDLSGIKNPINITMTESKIVNATFTTNQWWCCDWRYRRAIVIDGAKVSGELTDFPLLVEILDADLVGKTQPNGNDFVFVDENNMKLNHQIEFYDNLKGHLIAWVRVPHLSPAANTIIYLYYGNPICDNQQNPAGVWDANYKLVLHLNEKTGIHCDSTTNGNNGTPFKDVLQGVPGKIDGADTFDGNNDYIEISHSDTLSSYTEAFTVSFWIKIGDTSRRQTILCKYNTAGNMRSWQIEYDPLNCPNNPFWFFASKDGITYSQWWASFVPQANTWYYVTIVWQSNEVPKFYINGVQVPTVGTAKISSIYNNVGVPLRIGRSIYADRCFRGSLDEIRISNVARSSDWILTAYSNQLDPMTFYSLGEEEVFQETYTLTVHVNGLGSVTKTPEKTAYTRGENVTLTATATEGYEFQCWSGDITGTENSITITVTRNMNITAHFQRKQYIINASVIGVGGTLEPYGLITVHHGENITFTIMPDTGYHIYDVLVDGVSQGQISEFTFYMVNADHTIIVIFAPDE
ncbi:MAG: DUF2341 domain-containing protein [Candidatus Bathyarchaeia archaeon]